MFLLVFGVLLWRGLFVIGISFHQSDVGLVCLYMLSDFSL